MTKVKEDDGPMSDSVLDFSERLCWFYNLSFFHCTTCIIKDSVFLSLSNRISTSINVAGDSFDAGIVDFQLQAELAQIDGPVNKPC